MRLRSDGETEKNKYENPKIPLRRTCVIIIDFAAIGVQVVYSLHRILE